MIETLFPYEADGFEELAKAGKTIAYSPVLSAPPILADEIVVKAKLEIGSDHNTWDLFPLYSILVSVGWNKNTDVFDRGELWRARHSPKNKPLNYMHDQRRIIGHVVDNIVVGEDMKPIEDNTKEEDLPYRLHVVTASVIYKIWEDPLVQAEMNRILGEIDNGQWFVSMECLFKNFDYLLMDAKGAQKLLPRNSTTAFLTKHLRQYGGTGKYFEYTMGRLLRDITFSAQGLVNQPANPDSIISNNLNMFNTISQTLGYITLDEIQMETNMAETIVKSVANEMSVEDSPAYKALASKLEKSLKDNEALHAKCESAKAQLDSINEKAVADLKSAKEEAEKTVASLKAAMDEDEKEKEKMDKDCAALKAEVDSLVETKKKYEEASRSKARLEALMDYDKNITKAAATKIVEDFKDLSDATFTQMINTIASFQTKKPKEVTATEVLNKGAKAEVSAPLGVAVTGDFDKTSAAVKDWFNSKRNSKGEK